MNTEMNEETEIYHILMYNDKEENKYPVLFLVSEQGKRVFSSIRLHIEDFEETAKEKGFRDINKRIPKNLLKLVKETYKEIINPDHIKRYDPTEFYEYDSAHSPMLEFLETN